MCRHDLERGPTGSLTRTRTPTPTPTPILTPTLTLPLTLPLTRWANWKEFMFEKKVMIEGGGAPWVRVRIRVRVRVGVRG